jgi:hypothetical protein
MAFFFSLSSFVWFLFHTELDGAGLILRGFQHSPPNHAGRGNDPEDTGNFEK